MNLSIPNTLPFLIARCCALLILAQWISLLANSNPGFTFILFCLIPIILQGLATHALFKRLLWSLPALIILTIPHITILILILWSRLPRMTFRFQCYFFSQFLTLTLFLVSLILCLNAKPAETPGFQPILKPASPPPPERQQRDKPLI